MKSIRNFCIIAHIDHGKSTLADRMIETTGTLSKREMGVNQVLDTMELEQERGITIKLQPVRMSWKEHTLNLIDTPGHVDFTYEVSRSLAAVEGAILVIDATQGIEAQTLANLYMALEHNLVIIPVINKIDLPAADPKRISEQIENMLAIPQEEIIEVSAKEGTNITTLLDAIIERIPPPRTLDFYHQETIQTNETHALIFDSVYDTYRGVIAYIRLIDGSIQRGDTIHFLATHQKLEVLEVGYFRPKYEACKQLHAGEVGYIVTGLKTVNEARVGDTIWKGQDVSTAKPLPGYKKVQPMVYAGIFCTDASQYPELRNSLEKLSLSDSALTWDPENSTALGHGFRCGFLGLLHMEIVQERLEREYDLDLIATAPTVKYEVTKKGGEKIVISSAEDLPDMSVVESIAEPWVKLEVIIPTNYIGTVMDLCQRRRGLHKNTTFPDKDRAMLLYEIPLATIIIDFFDTLKSITSGYASMSYESLDIRVENLVRLSILIAGDPVDALASIIHRSETHTVGSIIVKKLKNIIPKAQFSIALQAAIGGKIIARETISALRKDVTGYLYGGDVSRKRKLLEKQKAGKKRMKSIGKITLPQEAFRAILSKENPK